MERLNLSRRRDSIILGGEALAFSQTLTSRSVEETIQFARILGSLVHPGTIITLEGDLGAGKTHFSQGLARGMGIQGVVNSPTFSLIKEYQGEYLSLYHMDLYRIQLEEAEELGLEEYFESNGVCIIEWASRIEEILPKERLGLSLHIQGEQQREIHCTAIGDTPSQLLQHWTNQIDKELGI
jgi:tRNA threonylcarbamoyladenosine biosynthesis protein TsaE